MVWEGPDPVPSPLRGGLGWGFCRLQKLYVGGKLRTPTLNPSPQGGGRQIVALEIDSKTECRFTLALPSRGGNGSGLNAYRKLASNSVLE